MRSNWDELNQQVISHIQNGQFKQALEPAKAALDMVKQEKSENHPDFAVSLNNLGELYHLLENYEEAESVLQKIPLPATVPRIY